MAITTIAAAEDGRFRGQYVEIGPATRNGPSRGGWPARTRSPCELNGSSSGGRRSDVHLPSGGNVHWGLFNRAHLRLSASNVPRWLGTKQDWKDQQMESIGESWDHETWDEQGYERDRWVLIGDGGIRVITKIKGFESCEEKIVTGPWYWEVRMSVGGTARQGKVRQSGYATSLAEARSAAEAVDPVA